MALEEARELIRALVLLDEADDCSIAYPTVPLGKTSYLAMLHQAVLDEQAILDLCCLLQGQLDLEQARMASTDSRPSYFLDLSQSLIRQSQLKIKELREQLLLESELASGHLEKSERPAVGRLTTVAIV